MTEHAAVLDQHDVAPDDGARRPAGGRHRKTYGVTRALKGVNFEVRRGKVTVLFGENGAGKSTLMKILSGVEQPTGGPADSRRRADRARIDQRCGGPRHLDHPPGAEPGAEPQCPGQHLHRPRATDSYRRDRLRPGNVRSPNS